MDNVGSTECISVQHIAVERGVGSHAKSDR